MSQKAKALQRQHKKYLQIIKNILFLFQKKLKS